MFGNLGGMEVVIIILVILLLFGAKKIPELARGIGQGINEFKKASNELRKEIERGATNEDETKSSQKDEITNKN